MNRSRREMMKLSLGAAALCAAPVRWLHAAPATKIPIGLQLYSVRNDCGKDLPGVLEAVAKMGYAGVEFAGYYGRKADELRKLLDDNGLKCCGTHTGINTLQGDALKGTVEFNQTIGNKYLIVPGLPKQNTESKDALLKTAAFLDEVADKIKADGMLTGYHAHGGDFQKYDGETHWDIIFGNTKPAVVMQMDMGNCLGGGGDPYATLKRYPGRAKTVHLKEHGGKRGAPVGEGEVKWNEVFEICETIGGTEWYIVEHESYAEGVTPLDSVKLCLDNLRKMGK
jgi:sugar phosphate isomerase/epimerase